MSSFRNQQLLIAAQIMLGIIICALAYWFGGGWFPAPTESDVAGRLTYLAPWLLVPALSVFVCTLITMLYRFFSSAAIEGTRKPNSQFLEINLRVTQNTLEQAFLASMAWFGLALALPAQRTTLIPVAALLFASGRILFWLGYQIHPAARALGFTLTAIPTALAYFWLIWFFV